jgi:hypothetical protein
MKDIAPARITLYLTAPTFCFLHYEHTFITSIEYDAQEQWSTPGNKRQLPPYIGLGADLLDDEQLRCL